MHSLSWCITQFCEPWKKQFYIYFITQTRVSSFCGKFARRKFSEINIIGKVENGLCRLTS